MSVHFFDGFLPLANILCLQRFLDMFVLHISRNTIGFFQVPKRLKTCMSLYSIATLSYIYRNIILCAVL